METRGKRGGGEGGTGGLRIGADPGIVQLKNESSYQVVQTEGNHSARRSNRYMQTALAHLKQQI